MRKNKIAYIDGAFVSWDKACVPIMSHSFSRGSAIFEVLSLHNMENKTAVFRLDDHIQRLFNTAELLYMKIPMTMDALKEQIFETVRKNNAKKGFIKIICYYPQISFDIIPPDSPLTVSIFIIDPEADIDYLHQFESEQGKKLYISKWRKYDPQTVPVEAKAAANYLNGMLAGLEAMKNGFQKAVMLDTQGFLAEGGTESIFLVQDEIIITPSLGTILESISRKSIMEAARATGMATLEKRINPEELMQADEIFLSGTPAKILPIKQIQDKTLKNVPGPVSRKLDRLMNDILKGKDRRFSGWLSYF